MLNQTGAQYSLWILLILNNTNIIIYRFWTIIITFAAPHWTIWKWLYRKRSAPTSICVCSTVIWCICVARSQRQAPPKITSSASESVSEHEQIFKPISYSNNIFFAHSSTGIVRAVDHDTNRVYLLPAVSAAQLAATNALAVCTTPLPTSLLTNHNRRVAGRVPYVYSTDDFIGSKHVVRISYRPDFTPKTA